jgi:hypothetical protein
MIEPAHLVGRQACCKARESKRDSGAIRSDRAAAVDLE